jgi:hypothetical protein
MSTVNNSKETNIWDRHGKSGDLGNLRIMEHSAGFGRFEEEYQTDSSESVRTSKQRSLQVNNGTKA